MLSPIYGYSVSVETFSLYQNELKRERMEEEEGEKGEMGLQYLGRNRRRK